MNDMITIKRLYFVMFLFSFFFLSCEKENGGLVNIRIKNSTGKDIRNLHIGDVKVGNLKEDGFCNVKLNTISFEVNRMTNGGYAKIKGEEYTNMTIWCATGLVLNTFNEGYFELEVFSDVKSKNLIFIRTN